MSETDDLVTGAFKLGAAALDTWLGLFKGLAISTAELVNPDDYVLAENAYTSDTKPSRAGPLCVGWLTTDKSNTSGPLVPLTTAAYPDAIPPSLLSFSPAGADEPVPDPNSPGAFLPQQVVVWITHPEALPTSVSEKPHFGALYLANDLQTPVGDVIISPSHESLPDGSDDPP